MYRPFGRGPARALAVGLAAASLAVSACDEHIVDVLPVANVQLSPNVLVVPLGGVRPLSAVVTSVEGIQLERTLQWSSDDESVAVVDTDGMVVGMGAGQTTVWGSADGVAGSALVAVGSGGGASGTVMSWTPTALGFEAEQGGADPGPATVSITSNGTGSLGSLGARIEYGSGASDWLTLAVDDSGDPVVVTVQPVTAGLPAGAFDARIFVDASAGLTGTVDVTLDMIQAGGRVSVVASPSSVGFNATEGGPDPAAAQVQVRSSDGSAIADLSVAVEYAAGQPVGWLAASLGSSASPATLSLQPSVGSLAAGTYQATARVSGAGANAATVSVTLTVAPSGGGGGGGGGSAARVSLNVSTVGLSASVGGADPDAAQVGVTNGGTDPLVGLAANVTYEAGQPTGWLQATLDGGAAPATLSLQASLGLLLPGTYTALVEVTGTAAIPDTVTVTFEVGVAVPPVIGVSPAKLTISATVGAPDPLPAAVVVANLGAGDLVDLGAEVRYQPGEPSGWLSTSLSATTAPATLTLSAATAVLPVGTYRAYVDVSATDAVTVTIEVTLIIVGAPVIGLSPVSVTFSSSAGLPPLPAVVAVANLGAGDLVDLSAEVRYAAGEPSGWLSAVLDAVIGPTLMVLTADVGGLSPGSYTAFVDVSASGAETATAVVNLTVN